MNEISELAEEFLLNFERLLNGDDVDSDQVEIELPLEAVLNRLFNFSYTTDGITGLISKKRKPRQILFEGKIWVVTDSNKWDEKLEFFKAIVTDKRITKQAIHIKVWFNDEVAEGEITEII